MGPKKRSFSNNRTKHKHAEYNDNQREIVQQKPSKNTTFHSIRKLNDTDVEESTYLFPTPWLVPEWVVSMSKTSVYFKHSKLNIRYVLELKPELIDEGFIPVKLIHFGDLNLICEKLTSEGRILKRSLKLANDIQVKDSDLVFS